MPSQAAQKIKTLSLWLSLTLLALHILVPASQHVARLITVGGGFPLSSCLTYQLLHANIFHCLCNLWALNTICFLWRPTVSELLLSYLISAAFGAFVWLGLPAGPLGAHILGLSAPIFAFLGLRALSVSTAGQFVRYNLSILVSNLLLALFASFLGSSLSWQAHLSCYLLGLIWSLINKPIIKTH